MAKAQHLRAKCSSSDQVQHGGCEEDDPETNDWRNEPVWTGISCVSSMTFFMPFYNAESSQLRGGLGSESGDECEPFDLQEIANSMNDREFATPPRAVVTQLPTPVAIGRNARHFEEPEGIPTLSTTQPPTPQYLPRHEGYGFSVVVEEDGSNEVGSNEDGEAEVAEVQDLGWGGIISVSSSVGFHWFILY